MGAVKMYRNSSLPSPGTMAADQLRYVKVGSSYIQYVIDNSGVAIPPAVMAHTHNISDVTGLQTALDGKSDTSHVHANATITVSGFMSAADKSKLDGLSNYTHPNSGVTAGTYRSVTVDAMGHVTAGTNPTTLAGYGIMQKYVSLDPADGFATPVQSSYDLNTAALTAYGYATTATNRPTGAAANGYFSTNAIDSTSFFQTFANPTVQDAFFFRRRNTSTNYAWLQVASREWVATQISGTTGRIGKFTGANTIGDSLLSESGIGIIANGGVFVSDVPHNSNIRGFSLWASGLNRWVFGKAGTESGSDSGSDFVVWSYNDAGSFLREPLRISRATGNVTFSGTLTASGGNSTQWNAAVPGTRTLTINGTTFDLSANRSWTISAGIGGSATVGRLPKMATTTTITDSLLSESGISIIANGGVFVSDVAHNSNVRGYGLWASGVARWSFGKAGTESGSDSGSDFVLWSYNDAGTFVREPFRVSRATGNVTFSGTLTASGGDSTQWNAAVPNSRTITINGTTFDLTANRSWTVAGGVGGSGTNGFIPKWNGSDLTNSSIDDSNSSYIKINKDFRVNNDGSRYWVEFTSNTSAAGLAFYNPSGSSTYGMYFGSDGHFLFQRGPNQLMRFTSGNNVEFLNGSVPFIVNSSTTVSNLSADMVDGVHASSLVQTSRTLTINGTTYDLSANRSWTISGGISGSGSTSKFTKWSGTDSVTSVEMYESGSWIIVGSAGTRRDLIVQGSLVPKQMTTSELASYSPGFYGALVVVTDGTEGLYRSKDNGSGGVTWVFVG